MDLQRDRNCSYWKEKKKQLNNSLQITKLKTCKASFKRGISYECRTLKTVVDSDVGDNGDEFNSVCCKYSQSLKKIVIQYG